MSRRGPERRRASCAADSLPSVPADLVVVADDAVAMTWISGSVARGPKRLLSGRRHRRTRARACVVMTPTSSWRERSPIRVPGSPGARNRCCSRGRRRNRSIVRIGLLRSCRGRRAGGMPPPYGRRLPCSTNKETSPRYCNLGEVARMYQTLGGEQVASPAHLVRRHRRAFRPSTMAHPADDQRRSADATVGQQPDEAPDAAPRSQHVANLPATDEELCVMPSPRRTRLVGVLAAVVTTESVRDPARRAGNERPGVGRMLPPAAVLGSERIPRGLGDPGEPDGRVVMGEFHEIDDPSRLGQCTDQWLLARFSPVS